MNHAEVEGTAQCVLCEKALCRLCIVPSGSSIFCSETCATQYEENEKFAADQQPSITKIKLKLTVMLLLIMLILYIAYAYASLDTY